MVSVASHDVHPTVSSPPLAGNPEAKMLSVAAVQEEEDTCINERKSDEANSTRRKTSSSFTYAVILTSAPESCSIHLEPPSSKA